MTIEGLASSKVGFHKRSAAEMVSVSLATDDQHEEIYQIRHEIYARELGQHPVNASKLLRDSLDDGNIYIVAKAVGEMAGFISVTSPGQLRYSIDKYFDRDTMPFTFDEGLYEVRLLTVLRSHRGSELAMLLMYAAFRWVEAHGGRQLVAIGRREILDLYLKAGLKPVGKFTRCGSVTYDLLHATVIGCASDTATIQRLACARGSKSRLAIELGLSEACGVLSRRRFFQGRRRIVRDS